MKIRPSTLTHSLILALAATLPACNGKDAAETKDPNAKPVVFVPIAPYEFVFERIAGDLIDLHVIVGPGDDPHSYSPTPKQIVQMSDAALLCSGELGFEGNFFVKEGDGINGPKHLNLLANLELLEGHCDHPSHQTEGEHEEHEHEDHKHEGKDHEHKEHEEHGHDEHEGHSHEDLNDPHVWLSPTSLKIQIDTIASELKQLLPADQASEIDANVAAFKEELTSIHGELSEQLKPHKGRKFYVYHGAFAYFAKDFGLEQIAVEVGNQTPTPKQLAGIIGQAKTDEVKLVFVQPQFDPTSATALADSIGGQVAPLDPLEKDIFTNLRTIAKAVAGAE